MQVSAREIGKSSSPTAARKRRRAVPVTEMLYFSSSSLKPEIPPCACGVCNGSRLHTVSSNDHYHELQDWDMYVHRKPHTAYRICSADICTMSQAATRPMCFSPCLLMQVSVLPKASEQIDLLPNLQIRRSMMYTARTRARWGSRRGVAALFLRAAVV